MVPNDPAAQFAARLTGIIFALLGAAVLVFFLLRVIPGDVCELRLGAAEGNTIDEDSIRLCRNNLGLDQSKLIQFVDFISDFVVFDLGRSMWTGRAVPKIARRPG